MTSLCEVLSWSYLLGIAVLSLDVSQFTLLHDTLEYYSHKTRTEMAHAVHSKIHPFNHRLNDLALVQVFQCLIQGVHVVYCGQLVDGELALFVPIQ